MRLIIVIRWVQLLHGAILFGWILVAFPIMSDIFPLIGFSFYLGLCLSHTEVGRFGLLAPTTEHLRAVFKKKQDIKYAFP